MTLLERQRFPRHHVGESLQPATFELLKRHLDLDGELASAGFARKYGAVYVWGESREPWSILFDARLEAEIGELGESQVLAGGYEHAWQVDRAHFDAILARRAAELGADVRMGAAAARPIFEGERVVGVVLDDGSELRGRHVIDASGQRCMLGRALGVRRAVEDLRFTASYCYFEGAGGFPGPLGRHVQWVVTVPQGWVWFIPISASRTSVGLVHQLHRAPSQEELDAILAQTELPLEGATLVDGLRHVRDWSYTSSAMAGPGWMLVGDAACFVDPILSGGVASAVRSGFHAALSVLRMLGGEDEAIVAAQYEEELRRDYKAYLRLARYWYGNNRSVDGLFWEAHKEIPAHATATPLRAFVYLTTGKYSAERHVRVFQEWQERKMFERMGVDLMALKSARARKAGNP